MAAAAKRHLAGDPPAAIDLGGNGPHRAEKIGAAPARKRAATSDMIIAMSATGRSLRAVRDRAIILLGFAGAFRRSGTSPQKERNRLKRANPGPSLCRSNGFGALIFAA